jgi:hypothetical protein
VNTTRTHHIREVNGVGEVWDGLWVYTHWRPAGNWRIFSEIGHSKIIRCVEKSRGIAPRLIGLRLLGNTTRGTIFARKPSTRGVADGRKEKLEGQGRQSFGAEEGATGGQKVLPGHDGCRPDQGNEAGRHRRGQVGIGVPGDRS